MQETQNQAAAAADPDPLELAHATKARAPKEAAELLAEYPSATIAAVLPKLPPALTQDILAELPGGLIDGIVHAAPAETVAQWHVNQQFAQGSIGRMMEPVRALFRPEMSVRETIEQLRPLVRTVSITYGYVVDGTGRLCGIVTMRDLLFARETDRLEALMLRDVFTLSPGTPLNEAMTLVLDRHYPVYPVCDADGILLGLVRGQAMFEKRAFEISAQPGSMVGVDKEERAATPLWQSFRMRHPWLQINLLTAFGTALVVSLFDATIQQIVVLAAFLPVLSCLAGNNGCQALAITLRGLTLGDLERLAVRDLIVKEVKVGALNGLFTGIVGGIAMYFFARASGEHNPALLGTIMLIAMVVTCMLSCLLGTLVPLAVRRYGADPATASSIFLLTFTDIIGMGFMLLLATWLVL
ncbi:MAG: magnesium transporter [Burkholderiales bacterium]|nr:magnesium transporter [Burkholderiales bacterium]